MQALLRFRVLVLVLCAGFPSRASASDPRTQANETPAGTGNLGKAGSGQEFGEYNAWYLTRPCLSLQKRTLFAPSGCTYILCLRQNVGEQVWAYEHIYHPLTFCCVGLPRSAAPAVWKHGNGKDVLLVLDPNGMHCWEDVDIDHFTNRTLLTWLHRQVDALTVGEYLGSFLPLQVCLLGCSSTVCKRHPAEYCLLLAGTAKGTICPNARCYACQLVAACF